MRQATNQAPDDYLSTGDAARFMGVSTRTILRYEARGVLTSIRLPSGHRRYRRADLEAMRQSYYGSVAS